MSDVEYIFGRLWGRLTASHFHLILSYNENTHSIFPTFGLTSSFRVFRESMRLRGSSPKGSIISSHLLPMLLGLNVEGMRGEIFAASPIAIPMQLYTQETRSDVWSQLAGDWGAICNMTRGIDAGHGVIRHWGVSVGSDGVPPLGRSHSARTEMFFADGLKYILLMGEPE
jgi:hypothetical protein